MLLRMFLRCTYVQFQYVYERVVMSSEDLFRNFSDMAARYGWSVRMLRELDCPPQSKPIVIDLTCDIVSRKRKASRSPDVRSKKLERY